MAKASNRQTDSEKPAAAGKPAAAETTTAVVTQQGGAVVALPDFDFEAEASKGMENTDRDSFAIPFLTVLQKGSPGVDETLGPVIEGAKPGMFYENVTGRIFEGKEVGVQVVQCAYRRVFIRWGARGTEGSGFKGEFTVEQVAAMREKGEIRELEGKLYFPLADGSVNEKKSDRLADTRNHYVLLIDPATGYGMQAVLSLTSTQVKASKLLMSMLSNVRFPRASGEGTFQPPTYASIIRLTTIPQSNDKGTWYGVVAKLDGKVQNAELARAAKQFNETVLAGTVQVRYEDTETTMDAAAGGPGNSEKF